ncbi:hypothetical protein Taro_021916, partial [Colocasia esculenta]|nr:hypothetical protein [Colocasia esculenta]
LAVCVARGGVVIDLYHQQLCCVSLGSLRPFSLSPSSASQPSIPWASHRPSPGCPAIPGVALPMDLVTGWGLRHLDVSPRDGPRQQKGLWIARISPWWWRRQRASSSASKKSSRPGNRLLAAARNPRLLLFFLCFFAFLWTLPDEKLGFRLDHLLPFSLIPCSPCDQQVVAFPTPRAAQAWSGGGGEDGEEDDFWKQPDGMGYRPCLDFSFKYKEATKVIKKDRRKYLMVVVSGGLNQLRNQIIDAVVIARILDAALVVPILQVNTLEVSIHYANKPDAPLFVKDDHRFRIKDAIGSHILWFRDYVLVDEAKRTIFSGQRNYNKVYPARYAREPCTKTYDI